MYYTCQKCCRDGGEMNIAFTITDSYVDYMAVTLMSILQQTATHLNVYILTSDLSVYSQFKVKQLEKQYSHLTCHIIFVNEKDFDGLPLNREHISRLEVYFRMAFPKLIPNTVDKILYLDSDLLVQKDLIDLWQIDFAGYYMAGVSEPFSEGARIYRESIGMKDAKNYVNSGVLLMDLKKMREDNIQELLFNVGNAIKDKIILQDQDIINVALESKIFILPQTYNFNHVYRGEVTDDSDMHIIHFALVKPWIKSADVSVFKRRSIDKYWHITNQYRQLIEPLVTVVVHIKAYANLVTCMDVLRKQTYKRLDIILLDETNSQETKQLCETWIAQDERVRYYQIKNNRSVIWNGYEKMLGDYIYFMESQQVINEHVIATLIQAIVHNGVDVVKPDVNIVSEQMILSGIEVCNDLDNVNECLQNNVLNGCLLSQQLFNQMVNFKIKLDDCFISRLVLQKCQVIVLLRSEIHEANEQLTICNNNIYTLYNQMKVYQKLTNGLRINCKFMDVMYEKLETLYVTHKNRNDLEEIKHDLTYSNLRKFIQNKT